MKITLRKANAVQNSITEAMRSVKIVTSVEISEFEDANVKITAANRDLFHADQRRSDMLMAQFAIRGLVGSSNAVSGIDAKLTQAAYIDKRIAQLTEMSSAKEKTQLSILEGKLDKIRNRKEESRASLYGRDDVVDSGVVEKSQIEEINNFIKDLKKQKQKLNDEVLELNVRTEIELSEETVNVLKSENLI
jgi:hypothetical protein